jgi:hypothetical protein
MKFSSPVKMVWYMVMTSRLRSLQAEGDLLPSNVLVDEYRLLVEGEGLNRNVEKSHASEAESRDLPNLPQALCG